MTPGQTPVGVADLTIAPPGRPDQGTTGSVGLDVDLDGAEEIDGQPVSLPTVIGLVKSAAGILAQIIGAQYPERPGIGRMTDDEAMGIATALVSWSTHNPALKTALEKSDALAVAFYLAGWAGRTTADITAVRRERKLNADHHREAEVDRFVTDAGDRPGQHGDPARDVAGWGVADGGGHA